MTGHATLAPSAAHRWKKCTGAIAAAMAYLIGSGDAISDNSSVYSREGNAAHILGERTLQYAEDGRKASFWIGEEIRVKYVENGVDKYQVFTVDDEMADNVQVYVDQVLREPGELFIEQRFDLSEVYGVPDQFGTGDAVVLDYENERIYVGDLKYGRGVQVYAKDNDQMYSYAAGALKEYDMIADWKTITVAVHQPRIHHYDEHTITRAELEAWTEETASDAEDAMALVGASAQDIENAKKAGEKQCMWCPLAREDRHGQPMCRKQAEWVHSSIYADFKGLEVTPEPTQMKDVANIDGEELSAMMKRADACIKFFATVRAEAARRATAIPGSVPGFKMVAGKKGARKWSDEDAAEEQMKKSRIKSDDMYNKKLLTYPAAETAFKKKKPKVWAKLKALMTQADGAPSIAPVEDERPALVVAESESFSDLTGEDDYSDLLG